MVKRPHDQRLPPERRVKKGADFDRAYRGKKSASDPFLVVYAAANDLPHARLGLSVGRRVGNAVRRNRWKRLLREAFRRSQAELPAGRDFILIPRPDVEPSLPTLVHSLVKLARIAAKKVSAAENAERRDANRNRGDEKDDDRGSERRKR